MAPLAPRVPGPLTTLSKAVLVLGVDKRADVVVRVDGHEVGSGPAAVGPEIGFSPGGSISARVKLDRELQPGERVTASQVVDGVEGPSSRDQVFVVDVPQPPNRPSVHTFPVAGVEAVWVKRVFPGAELIARVEHGGHTMQETMVAAGFEEVLDLPVPLADGDGLQIIQRIEGSSATWQAPGAIGAWGGSTEERLPAPVFALPPRACHRGIKLAGMVPGATAMVKLNGELLRARSVAGRVNVPVRSYVMVALDDQGLEEGDELVVWQEFPSTGQRSDPSQDLVLTVGPPEPPKGPVLWSGICPSATEIVVTDFQPGAMIRVYEAAPGPSNFELRDDLTHMAPLSGRDVIPTDTGFTKGAMVAVTQDPCRRVESPMSVPMEVKAPLAPSAIALSEPVLACATGVLANHLALGTTAAIWSDRLGGPVTESRLVTSGLPNWFDAPILEGDELRVVATGCIQGGRQESPRARVQSAEMLPPELDYAFGGDQTVWVRCSATDRDGETVPVDGAEVDVFFARGRSRTWIGSGWSKGNGWAHVDLTGWILQKGEVLVATARLCGDPVAGENLEVLEWRPPSAPKLRAPGATTTVGQPRFEWSDPDAGTPYEAQSYIFGIAEEDSGKWIRPWARTDLTELTWSGPPELALNSSYRWFVISVGRRGNSAKANSTVERVPPPAAQPPPPPAGQAGFSKLVVWNCNRERNSHLNGGAVTVFARDASVPGAEFEPIETLEHEYTASDSCGPFTSGGTEFLLPDGYVYDFAFVDPYNDHCVHGDPDEPTCVRLSLTGVRGKSGGPVLQQTIY
jgi:hypothetical protein